MADWTDLRRDGEFHAYIIQPNNLTGIGKEMEGVFWDRASFSAGYYSGTRTSGKLIVIEGSWRPDTLIRVEYEIPRWNYRHTIGTYIAKASTATLEGEYWTQELELYSMLYALNRDRGKRNTLIAPATAVSKAVEAEFKDSIFRYDASNIRDAEFSNAKLLEAGATKLARLNSVCSFSNNRIDVDPNGIITINKYIAPSDRTPVMTIQTSGRDSLVFEGIKRTNDYMEKPNIAIVSHVYQTEGEDNSIEEHQVLGFATLETSDLSKNRTSVFPIAEYYELNEMKPATLAQAEAEAMKRLEAGQHELIEWEVSTPYLPLWEGDVVFLMVDSGDEYYQGMRKCLVKNLDLSAPYGDLKLTLKEVAYGDTNETDGLEG